MKIYERHHYDSLSNDLDEIIWYKNVNKAMYDIEWKDQPRYIEWHQMGEHHYAGRMSADPKDDFYIILIREVKE